MDTPTFPVTFRNTDTILSQLKRPYLWGIERVTGVRKEGLETIELHEVLDLLKNPTQGAILALNLLGGWSANMGYTPHDGRFYVYITGTPYDNLGFSDIASAGRALANVSEDSITYLGELVDTCNGEVVSTWHI